MHARTSRGCIARLQYDMATATTAAFAPRNFVLLLVCGVPRMHASGWRLRARPDVGRRYVNFMPFIHPKHFPSEKANDLG